VKTVFLALLTLSLLALHSTSAQAYDPYYYQPADQYPQKSDPYYELHQIHYQLYRQRYFPIYHPYSPVQVFAIQGCAKQIRPRPQERRK
jgi:hypothetical protein